MSSRTRFAAFLPSFNFGEDALLILADSETIDWLTAQFDRLSNARPGSSRSSFVIGDGKPVESDGCSIVVEASDRLEGSQLERKSDGSYYWSLSCTAAHRYKELVSSLSTSEPAISISTPTISLRLPLSFRGRSIRSIG